MNKINCFRQAAFFIFAVFLLTLFSCTLTGFSYFGQTITKTTKKLEGDYTVTQMCIAPMTPAQNMSEIWLSKRDGLVTLIGTFKNPSRFSRDNIPISIDGIIHRLTGSNSYDAEIWGYTRAYAGAGGTLFTINIYTVLTSDILDQIKNSSEIKIDMSVPALERIETIKGVNLEKVKSFLD